MKGPFTLLNTINTHPRRCPNEYRRIADLSHSFIHYCVRTFYDVKLIKIANHDGRADYVELTAKGKALLNHLNCINTLITSPPKEVPTNE